MRDPFDLVVDRLRSAGCNPKSGFSRDGHSFEARCPAHDDKDPSLHVMRGRDHPVVFHCFAGCPDVAIVAALKLTWADVCSPAPSNGRNAERGMGEPEAVYRYEDAEGRHVQDVVRFAGKQFRGRLPDDRWRHPPEDQRILYRLPDLVVALEMDEAVYVVEGEKDCDALVKAGVAATCNPGGAGKWRERYNRHFPDADVVIVGDRDQAGAAHQLCVAQHLRPVARTVRLVHPAAGNDVADHLAGGHDVNDLVAVTDVELKALAAGTDHGDQADEEDRARFTTMAAVKSERVEWLWAGRLPAGKLVTLDGDPGLGKSTLALDLAARISTASPMPDRDRPDRPRDVVLLSAEDGLADTIRPRLDAAGANVNRVHVFTGVDEPDDDGTMRERPPSLPIDLERLERRIARTGAALVIVDVLNAFLHGSVDSHRDQDVRRALHAMARTAERTGATFLVLRHLNKSGGPKSMYRGGGSIGIIGAARAGLIVGSDEDEDEDRSVLAVVKSNLAAKPPSLAYRLVNAPEHGCARVEWLGTCDRNADDLVAPPDRGDTDPDAAAVLTQILEDGPRWVKDALDAMAGAGFSKDQANRAKRKLRVRSLKEGKPGDADSGWRWWLPNTPEDGAEPPEGGEGGGLRELPCSPPSCHLRGTANGQTPRTPTSGINAPLDILKTGRPP